MEKLKEACLFLNGTVPEPTVLKEFCSKRILRIAADGAYDYCLRLGLRPDVLIGDMDSIGTIPDSGDTELICDQSQDSSDLEKCLQYCRQRAISDLYIFGAEGRQTDHFLINIATLAQYAGEMHIHVYTRNELLRFLSPGSYSFRTRKGQRFSLLALEAVSGLLLEGARYKSPDGLLRPGSRGLGNSCIAEELRIRFESGILLYMTELS